MSAARTERLLNLLTLLLNARRPISLRELRTHDEFQAYRTSDPKSGERAFERDKAALVELGVPLRWVPPEEEGDEEGIGGYMIDRGRYFLPPLDLDPGELALLSIAAAAAAAIEGFPARPTVVRALAKLGFDVDEAGASASLAHAPILAGAGAARVGEHLQLLHDAVARRRTVRLRYRARGGEATLRDVDPYGLYYRQGVWYLVGYCHLRAAERTFHLARSEEVELSNSDRRAPEFEVPESFDLSTYVNQRSWELPGDPPVEVVVRVAERLVPAIPEMFGRRVRVERGEDGARVFLRVSNRAALIAAVLPFGAAAEVVEPEDLRQKIGAIYQKLAERYAGREVRA